MGTSLYILNVFNINLLSSITLECIETSGLTLPSVFENNSTKMSRRRRMCFVLYLLSEYSCSLRGSTPSAPPATSTSSSFLLSLPQHCDLRCVLALSLLSLSSVRLPPPGRAWWLAVGLIISLHSQPGGDHLSPRLSCQVTCVVVTV